MNITKKVGLFFASLTLGNVVFALPSYAIELDDATRTVALTASKTTTLTPEQVKRGKRVGRRKLGSRESSRPSGLNGASPGELPNNLASRRAHAVR